MNRAQKNAWFGFGFSLIASTLMLFIIMLTCSTAFQTFPWVFGFTGVVAVVFVILLLFSFIFRKRSTGDIEADERDQQITNQAVKVSFTTVWPFLILANIVTIYFAGITGPVPAILFVFIHVGIFVFTSTIYFLSILTCYRTRGGAA